MRKQASSAMTKYNTQDLTQAFTLIGTSDPVPCLQNRSN